jgi:hypothetical protein
MKIRLRLFLWVLRGLRPMPASEFARWKREDPTKLWLVKQSTPKTA